MGPPRPSGVEDGLAPTSGMRVIRGLARTVCCLVLVACGHVGSPQKASSSSARAPSTTTAVQDTIDARPPSGPLGTLFQLRAAKFQPGEKVAVEIGRPDGQVYKGQGHVVTADDSIRASYRTTSGDQVGTYEVRVTASSGRHDVGHFEVTPSRPPATTASKAPATSKH